MKWLLTGIVPIWQVVLFFLLLSWLTIMFYRKQRLRAPWNVFLPLLRIAAVALLLATLLQPVLARFHSEIEHGKIPVIVDDSGSMSISDQYEKPELIELAWHMELFPRELRTRAFIEQRELEEAIDQALAKAIEETKRLNELARRSQDQGSEWPKRAARLAREAHETAQGLDTIRTRLEKAVGKHPYLDQAKPEAFPQPFALLTSAVTNLQRKAVGWEKRAKKMKERSSTGALLFGDLTMILRKEQRDWHAMRRSMSELQTMADRLLADAGVAEVDQALERLAEMSRADLVRFLLFEPPYRLLDRLDEKGEVLLFNLEDETEPADRETLAKEWAIKRPVTRLGRAVREVLRYTESDPVTAIVLISDGNNNAGVPLNEAGTMLEERGIALHALALGSRKPPDDLAVEHVQAPDTCFLEHQLSVQAVIHRRGFPDQPVVLRILSEGEVMREVTIQPGDEERINVDASFVEERKGRHHYMVELTALDGEVLVDNNRRDFTVNILEDRIKTLMIDEFPRWESRYCNMMLKRDRRVDLTTIFIGSTEDARLHVGQDEYPASRGELFAYHIVILGDIDPRHFSRPQLEDLRDFVTERGGALILVAGPRCMPVKYEGTALKDLLPFVSASGQTGKAPPHSRTGSVEWRLQLTREGRHENLVRIGEDPETTEALWNKLPGMNWVQSAVAPTEAADFTVRTAERDLPVMIKAYAGLGKVLYLGSDSFWRWRNRARWRYHHRFWGQVLLWSTVGRTTGADPYVKLMTDRLRYAPGESVQVRARILDEQETPIEGAQATLEVFNEQNEVVRRLPLHSLPGSGGEYRASIENLPRDRYTIKPRVFELRDKKVEAKARFEVGELATSEYIQLARNEAALRRLTDNVLPWNLADEMVKALKPMVEKHEHREDFPIWNSYYLIVAVTILLGLEWQLRKMCKLA